MFTVKAIAASIAGLGTLLLAACSEPSAADAVPAGAAEPAGPALWKTGDADTEVYVFGSVHILPASLKWRTQELETAMRRADAVYFETDVHPNPGDISELVSRLGLYPPSERLSMRLSGEQREALAAACRMLGVQPGALEQMRPWLAAMTLSEAMTVRAGYDPDRGVERSLEPDARRAGKPIRRLETVAEQLAFFAELPEEVQVAYLMDGLADIEGEISMLDDLVAAWARGDMDALASLMIEEDLAQAPLLYERVLLARNRNWAGVLDTLIDEEPGVFLVVVGAGHLAGDGSLLDLLSEKERPIERVQ